MVNSFQTFLEIGFSNSYAVMFNKSTLKSDLCARLKAFIPFFFVLSPENANTEHC